MGTKVLKRAIYNRTSQSGGLGNLLCNSALSSFDTPGATQVRRQDTLSSDQPDRCSMWRSHVSTLLAGGLTSSCTRLKTEKVPQTQPDGVR
jgi:hypothetical protein